MSVSKRLRYEIFRRDTNACRYCGATAPEVKLTIDHVIPVTLGGTDDPSNLVTACKDCNAGKSASNPDAALVAGVAQDALRWARAQQVTAQRMLEELGARDRDRAEFKSRWDTWSSVGKSIPLPDSWGPSVDRFLSAGLPMPILLDCVDRAMAVKRIAHHDLFRYMCGIAWNRVEELRAATTAQVSPGLASRSRPTGPTSSDVLSLLTGALGALEVLADPVGRTFLAECFDAAHEDDEPVGAYSAWDEDTKAAVYLARLELGHVSIEDVARELVDEQLEDDLDCRVAEVTDGGLIFRSRHTTMNLAILAAVREQRMAGDS